MSERVSYAGGCHCGAVRFVVEADARPECHECNCSVCSMSGYIHLIVPSSRFSLTRGQDALSTYTFGSGVAQHTFCRTCGIKPFCMPRSNPDGVDVNLRCLDEPPEYVLEPFDGQNWEKNAASLAHLSAEAP